MMGHKEKLKTSAEYDQVVFRDYCYLDRGSKLIKQQMNRRNRRKGKYSLKEEIEGIEIHEKV